jgi:hypothetical protein
MRAAGMVIDYDGIEWTNRERISVGPLHWDTDSINGGVCDRQAWQRKEPVLRFRCHTFRVANLARNDTVHGGQSKGWGGSHRLP